MKEIPFSVISVANNGIESSRVQQKQLFISACIKTGYLHTHTTLESGIFVKNTMGFGVSYRNLVGVRSLVHVLRHMFLVASSLRHLSAIALATTPAVLYAILNDNYSSLITNLLCYNYISMI